MKRSILFFVSIFLLLSFVMAEPVDSLRALQVAKQFIPQNSSSAKKVPKKGKATEAANIVYTHKMPKSGRDAFYIVNVDDAFVLVSADDIAHQILGYSFDKGFPVNADGTVQLPPHIKGFFDDLAAQIEAAIEAEPNRAPLEEWSGVRKIHRAPSNLPESVGPLLTTTWDQGQYYNALCPEDESGPAGHVLTGSVATAMAQIIKYWGEPVHGRGIHSYESNYGILEVNFAESNYDFDNMPDALTGESTAEQVNAVARLMYDCGVAVNMSYSFWGSNTFDQEARAGLINFFRFSANMSFVEKNHVSIKEWNNLLRQNLAANHPVYYCGHGIGFQAFVCDGYKADDYYHFNFGWGGLADGWFLTSAVTPNDKEFNSYQSAIVDIVPDNTGNIILGQMKGMSTFIVDQPLEFYHLMGHNKFEGGNNSNSSNNTVTFIPADDSKQVVADIMEYEDQNLQIYDGTSTGNLLRSLYGGRDNDISPIVSSANAITVKYLGNIYNAGFKLNISQDNGCRMVSNITSHVEATTVHLTWIENGGATQWQIEYGIKGFELGNGVVYNTDTNTATLENLEKFTEYDFYIRPSYGNDHYGPWNKTMEMVEAPYWTEVVTEQPEGYSIDDAGNIIISSAEGLAWFSKLMASTNYEYLKCNVSLVADINLGQYKWKPINYFSGIFDGQGHRIDSMFAVEREYGSTALFGGIHSATIKNIYLTNCYSRQLQYQAAAGLVADIYSLRDEFYNDTIMNCYVSGMIEGHGSKVAPIIPRLGHGVIINCATNCVVRGGDSMVGGIVADGINGGRHGIIRNCYSASTILSTAAWQGHVIGYSEYDLVENCYGYIGRNGNMSIVNGSSSTWRDNTWFDDGDNGYVLLDTLFFEPDNQSYNNLKEVLNAGVRKYNIHGLRLWVDDVDGINDGMPLLGPEYIITCPNIKNLTAKNKMGANEEFGVELSWLETGSAEKWEVKYHVYGDSNEDRLIVSTNPYKLFGLKEQTTYCFSVRPICSSTNIGGWSEEVSIVIDRPYWTEIITSQPDGYSVDNLGNVTISSAEGLAWLVSVTNGLNGVFAESFEGKSVVLTQDIDIGKYKWVAINGFLGVFDAKEYVVNGLYVNELNDNQGLFGHIVGGTYLNVILENADVRGRDCVGMLFGYANNISVINCRVSGSAYGEREVGGLLGRNEYGKMIEASSSSGKVVAKYDTAGGLIGIAGSRTIIRNSFSRCDVTANRYTPGGLVGECYASIDNCYAIGNVKGFLYNGGLTGSLGSHNVNTALNNSYYGGKVSRTGNYSINNCMLGYLFGTITGTTFGNPDISNCYSFFDALSPYQLVGPSSDVDENCNVLGNPIVSNTVPFAIDNNSNILLEHILIGQTPYNDLLDALNAWVDENNTEGQYLHWVADTENVNGGFPVFAPAYTLTYKVDGEVYKSSMLEAGVKLPMVVEPTKEGYTFGGWNEIPETMPDHDVEVTGTFYLYGDVNTDTKVNVVDVVDIARYVVDDPSKSFRQKLADLNKDLAVNIADAVVLVNHIAGDQNLVKAVLPISSLNDYESCSLSLLYGEMNDLSFCLTGNMDFTAFQFEIDVPEGMDISAIRINGLRKDGHQLLFNKVANNRYRIAALSFSNAVFKGNEGEVVNIRFENIGVDDICIHDIHFVTSNGTDVRFDNLYINGAETGFADIHNEGNRTVYDLQGRRRSTLQCGVNIVGGKKMIVR